MKQRTVKLIAKIFGEMPTKCPQCGDEMKLVGFVFDSKMLADVNFMSRAPPKMTVTKYSQMPEQPVVIKGQGGDQEQTLHNQLMPNYEDLDQSISW